MLRCLADLVRPLIVLVTVVSLSAVAYGHRSNTAPVPAEITAILLLGGSLADICDVSSEDGGFTDCDACRLSDGFGLTGVDRNAQDAAAQYISACAFVAKETHRRSPIDRARLTRAPPQA